MSYTTIWLHCVWCTKNREHIISRSFRPVLLTHFRDMANEKGIMLDYVNLHKDHVHALINLGRKQTIADVMQQLKGESSHWINQQNIMPNKFYWQDDYYAVSVSQSQLGRVRKYIKNQDEHHRKIGWEGEVQQFIKKYSFEKISG